MPTDHGTADDRRTREPERAGARNPDPPARHVTDLLVASAMGVYLLVIVGASTALLDGAGACPTWPACNGHWLPRVRDPALLAAWSHRVATLVVGGLLAGTTWVAHCRGVRRRVRLALGAVLVLYPGQIALGGLTVVGGTPAILSAAHLVVAMAIFSGVLLALLWHLESGAVLGQESSGPRSEPVVASGPTRDSTRPATSDSTSPDPTTGAVDRRIPEGSARDCPWNLRRRALEYFRLTKPKLWWLLCLVAVAAMGLAAGPDLPVGTVVATVTGGIFAIGASGTFNNVLERDIDRRMDRTADRPLATGRIPLRRAIAFGVALAAASFIVFVAFVNVLAAALGLLAILFYSVVYTLVLKPNTTKNIVIGGAVGAFPALIGWAAVENAIGTPAVVLGAVIFLWTPAHFYNLALAYREDYASGGFPMLPVVCGDAVTRRHILLYLGATMLGAVLLGMATRLGWAYAATATLLGGVFLWAVVRLHRERSERAALRAFHASNAYLGSLLLVVVVDAIAL